MLFKIFYRHVYSLRCHLLGLLRLCLLQPSTQSHSLHKECLIQQILHVMVFLITQLVMLPFTSIAELLHQSEGNIFITAQSFVKLYQLLHPRTIPTSTIAMLLVLQLYIYNNHCILTIDYIPYYIAKELRLFQKIDSERNLVYIFNCYQMQNLGSCFIFHRLNVKPSWSCLLQEQTTLVQYVALCKELQI